MRKKKERGFTTVNVRPSLKPRIAALSEKLDMDMYDIAAEGIRLLEKKEENRGDE